MVQVLTNGGLTVNQENSTDNTGVGICKINTNLSEQRFAFVGKCQNLWDGSLTLTSPIQGVFDAEISRGGTITINVKEIASATYDGWKGKCGVRMKNGQSYLIDGYCPVDDRIEIVL